MRTTVLKSVLGVSLALAGFAAGAGNITGSAHDFGTGTGTSGSTYSANTNGQICIACHTPHNALVNVPLWNHTANVSTGFTMYTSGTMNAVAPGAPANTSLLCLSCHDGTVAVNSFGATPGAGLVMISGGALMGKNLSNDHPISITYNTALATADGALFNPVTKSVTVGSGSKVKTDVSNVVLLNTTAASTTGTVECSSCHDVHNTFTLPAGTTAGTSGTGTKNKLIRVSMFGSALCLSCHDK